MPTDTATAIYVSPTLMGGVVHWAPMTNALKVAMKEVSNLPKADQETIGRRLLSHVEKLQQLRVEIEKGIRSLDAGKGTELSVEDFISARYGKA